MKKLVISAIYILTITSFVLAQTPIPDLGTVFQDDFIPRVSIIIPADDLNFILDPNNAYSDQEFQAKFIFLTGTTTENIDNIGFRIRGNTSRTAAKKSFKISFNTFESGRKFHGLEKMNLNGEHNDPTIMRSKLCWDLLRNIGIPAPRANHVELYINGNYYGLYLNVEHIDEEFVKNRFGNKDGNLYKCLYPADFSYQGTNPDDYKYGNDRRVYDLKTNTSTDNYTDIAEFIRVLNFSSTADLPCKLEKIFNVDDYLKVLAFDILTGNWDGPIWNKNNCYLYKNTATGKFEYIPYDLDNTFGVSWFQNINWTTRDIYQWSNDWEARPIYEKIMAVQEYKDRFSFYMDQILGLYFNYSTLAPRVNQLKNMITPSVTNDIPRTLDYGFTMTDFHNAFIQQIRTHLPHGISNFTIARSQSANAQIIRNNIKPVLTDLKSLVLVDEKKIQLSIHIFDNNAGVSVKAWHQENNGTYTTTALFDDGQHNDEQANDGIFGGKITLALNAGEVKFYIEATDNQGAKSRFPRCDKRTITFTSALPPLVINEIMASNETAHPDEAGEYDDWIEIYNAHDQPVFLGDKYLSDNPDNPTKWALPNTSILPDEYLLIWADNDENQGNQHANFKLKKSGETLGIYSNADLGFAALDLVTYPEQTTDVAYGRLPNGTGEFQSLDQTTPNANNDQVIIVVEPPAPKQFLVFPNPFQDDLTIFHPYDQPLLRISNAIGQTVFSAHAIEKNYTWQGINQQGAKLDAGVYFITLMEEKDGKWLVLESKRVVISRK